jgi:hypothetical protein
MSDDLSAPVVDATTAPSTDAPVQDSGGELSLRQAAQLLSQARRKPEQSAESAEPATAEPELAQANADPETAPSEETEANEPEENLPPIEPPGSWTKAEKERFQSLPRETQEYLHTREQERDRDFRRSQNEIAEQRKAIQAEREAAEKARKEYEAKLPSLMQTLQETGPFGDIRSMADLERLQQEDPFRFQAYQLHQWKLQAAQAEQAEIKTRQEQEKQNNLQKYQMEETEKLSEFVPEVKDPEKLKDLTGKAIGHLKTYFDERDLNGFAAQGDKPFIYSAGFQRILLNSMKYEDIQKAKAAVASKPLPPVQKPGTSKPASSGPSAQIQALEARFNQTGSLKDAQALHAAQARLAQRRAS